MACTICAAIVEDISETNNLAGIEDFLKFDDEI